MKIRIPNSQCLAPMFLILLILTGCRLFDYSNSTTTDSANSENIFVEQTFPTASPIISENPPQDVPDDLKIVWEAWTILNKEYVDQNKVKDEKLPEFAVRGLLSALGDSQTNYVDKEYLEAQFSDIFRGEFGGIGAHVNINAEGKIIIVSPIEGSPAEKAGIKAGDIVLEVDGESLRGIGLLEAVNKIRGPKGSTVTLLIKHILDPTPIEISVIRDDITLPSVILRSEPGDTFAHIRLTTFYPNTPDILTKTIKQVMDDDAKGIILDLRGNSGGVLGATVDIASEFLDDGLVFYLQDGKGRRQEHAVKPGGIAKDIPMVVIANSGSASATEVLIGALQDHKRAQVIGTNTFGKGSVNMLRKLSNGGGVYLTIAYWYTPLGRKIAGQGLPPDIEVKHRDAKQADIQQYKRAIEELELLTGIKQKSKDG